jgi:hypothetical protein
MQARQRPDLNGPPAKKNSRKKGRVANNILFLGDVPPPRRHHRGGVRGAFSPTFTRTTSTSKSLSEAVFINVAQYYCVMEQDMAGARKSTYFTRHINCKMAVLSYITPD